MVKIITENEFINNEKFYINEFKKGKIFVYPTDTIYGLGCVISNENSIKKIYKIKQRDIVKPFSIIVPNRFYIFQNFKINIKKIKYLFKIPKEKLTLVLTLKNKNKVKNFKILNQNENTIGIRLIDNFIQKTVEKMKIPIITTSVNITNEKQITKISQIDNLTLKKINYIIDCGELNNKSSKIINLKQK
jgi:L-threonylcarbamoyladenylate synthase